MKCIKITATQFVAPSMSLVGGVSGYSHAVMETHPGPLELFLKPAFWRVFFALSIAHSILRGAVPSYHKHSLYQ